MAKSKKTEPNASTSLPPQSVPLSVVETARLGALQAQAKRLTAQGSADDPHMGPVLARIQAQVTQLRARQKAAEPAKSERS